jgi:tRNA-dihydrouridine synthase A
MMDWTDRHCRYFHRLMSRRALLYTEMIAAPALVRGGATHLLAFDPAEHPVAVQLGGSDPSELAEATRIAADRGFDEVNLNVGCPSDRVRSGCFGAVLMETPALVQRIVAAMIAASPVEVTVKCRIGVDDQNAEEVLPDFLSRLRDVGLRRVTVHARKAWLQGLSPKENREIPPLDYPLVRAMKERFPDLHVSINGGVTSLEDARALLASGLDGVMIGRAAYHAPADILLPADRVIFGEDTVDRTPHEVARAMIPYIDRQLAEGHRLHAVTRHMLGLFAGQPGARLWRRYLSDHATRSGAGSEVVEDALALVPTAQDRASA